MSSFTDNFNRTHLDPIATSGDWTLQTGSILIFTTGAITGAKGVTGGVLHSAFVSSISWTPHHSARVFQAIERYAGVGVRMSGTGGSRNGYFHYATAYDIGGTFYSVFKIVNGTLTGLVPNTGIAWNTTDPISLSISGTTLSYYRNDVLIGTVTDSSLSTGSPGIALNNNDTTVDNFSAEDIAAPLAPVVETLTATSVQSTSATLRGRIDPNGLGPIDGRFRWWVCGESPPSYTETTPQAIGSGDEPITYTEPLTGLTPSTTYCFQAIGDDGSDIFGVERSFTTSGEAEFIDGTVSHPLTWIELYVDEGDV